MKKTISASNHLTKEEIRVLNNFAMDSRLSDKVMETLNATPKLKKEIEVLKKKAKKKFKM